MTVLEERVVSILDDITIESITFLFLLSTNYLLSGNTRCAFVIFGMAVRAAQAMGLHKETTWGPIDTIACEVRRRVWWSLYMADGYVAQAYGRPAILNERDFQVHPPLDMNDTSATCPGFNSLEPREDRTLQPVTTLSYNRYKAKLYLIAAPITRNMYFKNERKMKHVVNQVKDIHRRLLEWERGIPYELRLSSFTNGEIDVHGNPLLQKFAMQALTLQLSYDNIQLLLFRPFIGIENKDIPIPDPGPTDEGHLNITITAQNQCWISATRTSLISRYPEILRLISKTLPCIHIGLHCLTAGVMLGVLAMSNQFCSRTQECKRGIARILSIPEIADFRAPLWDQSSEVLTDLLHLIANEEIKALITGGGKRGGLDECTLIREFGMPEPNLDFSSISSVLDLQRTEDEAPSADDDHSFYQVQGSLQHLPLGALPDKISTQTEFYQGIGGRDNTNRRIPNFLSMPFAGLPGNGDLDRLGQIWMWDDSFSFV
ncbi:hypothetical protein K469DRAFT_581402 [Zopfia rhizophila CBS 207.26]|uniref:Xylanolytic transcriptional activator regulatory domain-containing protein n=1 Tax=Zopfia rhizophila CBS 207.26 TaxID=1314779 RepID=A0A6A6E1K6_9PEZI|nr:hypothetical protein K469DRAFT_581402 [Zopfia rhizophila CBS 207.26]